jgi:hypothetical protein
VEAGIMGGGMFYIGDLTEKAMLTPVHPAGGMFIRINLNNRISLKGNVILGSVSGSDSLSKDAGRRLRNLSFQSNISEFAAELELNLVDNYKEKGERRFCVPYLFAGINIFHYNPQAFLFDSLTGKKILFELQPQGTEGQGLTKYPDKKRYAFPLGMGVKFHLGDFFTLGLEFGMRKTLTDYLDDVSGYYAENDLISAQYGKQAGRLADRSAEIQPGYENPKNTIRGNPSTQDWYGFGGVLISYTFIKKSKIRCSNF